MESGTNSRRSADVEDWMGASVWRVGRTGGDRLMYVKAETDKRKREEKFP